MRTIKVEGQIFVLELSELQSRDRELLLLARHIQNNAQSPYSKFKVGAAVREIAGHVSLGVNVERCTYTQTTHAEQNAIDTMVTKYGPVAIDTIAISAVNSERSLSLDDINSSDLIFPCGHCLQIIWENCLDANVRIFSYLGGNLVAMANIGSLLPVRFGPSDLGISILRQRET